MGTKTIVKKATLSTPVKELDKLSRKELIQKISRLEEDYEETTTTEASCDVSRGLFNPVTSAKETKTVKRKRSIEPKGNYEIEDVY